VDFAKRGKEKNQKAEAAVGFIGWLEIMNAVVHKLPLLPVWPHVLLATGSGENPLQGAKAAVEGWKEQRP